jgi:hypothetical protein
MKSWPIEAVETEMRRLKVLQYLASVPSYEASAAVLTLHCRRIGVPTTPDQMAGCLAWLEEQELVAGRQYQGMPIAKITASGREVGDGNRVFPGVLRPDP